jgi:hypothetical protein
MHYVDKLKSITGVTVERDLTACLHQSHADRCKAPFFRAFHALAIDDAGRWACFPLRFLAAFEVELVMDPVECAIPVPKPK